MRSLWPTLVSRHLCVHAALGVCALGDMSQADGSEAALRTKHNVQRIIYGQLQSGSYHSDVDQLAARRARSWEKISSDAEKFAIAQRSTQPAWRAGASNAESSSLRTFRQLGLCMLANWRGLEALNSCCLLLLSGQNIRKLIKDGFVIRKPTTIHSRARARRQAEAKAKGRHTGYGEKLTQICSGSQQQ